MSVLTINGGSSSIRFAFYGEGERPAKLLDGKIERIGQRDASMIVRKFENTSSLPLRLAVDAANQQSAVAYLMDWIEAYPLFRDVSAVGHRVVHGMEHTGPARVTALLMAELKRISPYDRNIYPARLNSLKPWAAGFRSCRRWRVSIRPSIAACRASRR